MKIINVVIISVVLFSSVGFSSAAIFLGMDDIVTDDCTPTVEFIITDSHPIYMCNLIIDGVPSGVGVIYDNVPSSITCNKTLEAGIYEYYISTYDAGYSNSSSYILQTSSSNYPVPAGAAVEAIGYLGDGFQHIGDSAESLLLWGMIFCAIVILLGMIAVFLKALRG